MKKASTQLSAPQTKSLFRFKNTDTKPKFFGNKNELNFATTVENTDPTITTTIVVTH